MYIYREEEIKKVDENAAKNGLSVNTLMETAGRSIYYSLIPYIKKENSILILSGKGNNGGDGIVLSRYLKQFGYQVDLVFPFGNPKSPAAKEHFRYYKSLGFSFDTVLNKEKNYDVIIDSMLGVGFKLPLRKEVEEIILWCNKQHALRIAIDIPTGVVSDQGDTTLAFQADLTFSLHGYKPSAFLYPSSRYFGKIEVIDIGLPHTGKWRIWTKDDVRKTLTKRTSHAHKGTFGTGLLVAGSDEMPGCALLAGLGAMKLGIGKLLIGTTKFVASTISGHLPEATYWFIDHDHFTDVKIPDRIQAIAIGPGLTNERFIQQFLQNIWEQNIPLILDAGALQKGNDRKRQAPTIITPHPGEMSRLIGISTEEIQKNRIQIASQYAVDHGIIVVLKGKDTVIALPDGSGFINCTGNPGLAKGGSGDTLTGMLLALLCSEKNPIHAVCNAVYLHGLSADYFLQKESDRSLVASQLTEVIGPVIRSIMEE